MVVNRSQVVTERVMRLFPDIRAAHLSTCCHTMFPSAQCHCSMVMQEALEKLSLLSTTPLPMGHGCALAPPSHSGL